jgi:hypothetical protein
VLQPSSDEGERVGRVREVFRGLLEEAADKLIAMRESEGEPDIGGSMGRALELSSRGVGEWRLSSGRGLGLGRAIAKLVAHWIF